MRRWTRILLCAVLGAALLSPAAARTPVAFAAVGEDAVIVWSANAGEAATAACLAPLNDPLHEARIYAMMHLAIHDALNAIDRRSSPYALDMQAEPGASPDAAVAAAARDVLVPLIGQLPLELFPQTCIDAGVFSVETDYTDALAAIPDGQAKAQGIAVGQAAAAAILARRAADGAVGPFLNFACPQDTDPGEYQCTPGTPFIAFQVWEKVTPFALHDSSQFRPGPPYALKSKKYAADFNEVKSLGSLTSTKRTADQTAASIFWQDNGAAIWNRIHRSLAMSQGLDIVDSARLFAMTDLAAADGAIGCWNDKAYWSFWRPITAIREAAGDGNPATKADPTWVPLFDPTVTVSGSPLVTPGFPDHPSGHGCVSGATVRALQAFFGTDMVPFTAVSNKCSPAPCPARTFDRFSDALKEIIDVRVWSGIHFRTADVEGAVLGKKVARYMVNHYFAPTG